MRDDTRQGSRGARGDQDRPGQLAELGLPLEELVRRGARDILQRAIEAEVQVQLDEFASVSLIDGRRAVVRNGYLPARAILTTVGPVEVQVPKVRDRSGSGVKFNSALAPPYVRRPVPDQGPGRRGAAVALPQRDLQRGPRGGVGGAGGRGGQGALPGRSGPAQGRVERGLPGLDAAQPGGQGVRLLVMGWSAPLLQSARWGHNRRVEQTPSTPR